MTTRDIKILETRLLRGPNMWAYRPALEVVIDIGELEDFPSNTLPGFNDRLKAWLPGLIEHRCSYDERGGFLRRLDEGTWPGHILEHVTLELETLAGVPGGFGRAREMSRRGVYKVIIDAWQPDVAETALRQARALVLAAIAGEHYDVKGAVAVLRDLVDDKCLGPSTSCIVNAADDRKIPIIRLNDGNLVQLGYGARQRRIWTAETEHTSAIAEGISKDKDLTKQLLAGCGIPVPEGRRVADPADAWEAAEELGLPVVVKPVDANHGRGVFTNLHTREEIEAAWSVADKEGSGVIVERFISGNEHRLLVVGRRMVAAARGDIASVIGDGRSTIGALIESQLNSDPRRGTSEDSPLNPVRLDSAARLELAHQGLSAESVPPEGRRVLIQRNGNVAIDVTDQVHPSTAEAVALAARVVGLDIAGIDLVAEDISRPLAEQRGAVVEVNAGPGLLMHLKPAEGSPRPVGQAICDHLFPEGESARIPIVGIAGSSEGTEIARLVARLMRLHGHRVGVASRDGLFFDRRQVDRRDGANWATAHKVLLNRNIDAAVFENGARTMAAEGLAYDRCQVGVVTDLDPSGLMEDLYIDSPDRLYAVLRTQVDVVLAGGASVLNAADERVVEMATLSDGEVIFYGRTDAVPALAAHRGKGGRAVFARDRDVVLATGADEHVLRGLAARVGTGGHAPSSLDNVVAAVGAAWALGIAPQLIRTGIETYGYDEGTNGNGGSNVKPFPATRSARVAARAAARAKSRASTRTKLRPVAKR
jgi:cyanophycin synthetase